MGNKTIDFLLLHAPSVYDFRKHGIMYGPISDMIPSSPVFEMYPLGFLTITSYLEKRGLRVRIVNLALRMMNDAKFDVPHFISKLNVKAIGIDLHWLPHAHGSLEIAKICKDIHPDVPIIFGGLSASYFHKSLIEYPQVDFVLRGDSTEPPLFALLTSLADKISPVNIPNLTWKEKDIIRVNPFTYIPSSLDYVNLNPMLLARMVFRYRDLESVLPFNGWWSNPITAVLTVKGCTQGCVTCGGSSETCQIISKRKFPIFRSAKNLVENMLAISNMSKGPIFLVGDLLQHGNNFAYQVLEELKIAKIKNEIVFEFFGVPTIKFLRAIDNNIKNWSIELSPESHDEEIRRVQNEAIFYTNREMEKSIEEALRLSCNRVDVFFMIGLPKQTKDSVTETIRYCESIFKKYDNRVSCFISPMGPFLDPGSIAFEEPEKYGYRMFARTLEEHRQLLIESSWKRILNYETDWMTRDDLVDTTYNAGDSLNRLKMQYGRISQKQGAKVADRIDKARVLKKKLDLQENLPQLNEDIMQDLRGEINAFSVSTVAHKNELFWKPHKINFRWINILKEFLFFLMKINNYQ